MKKEEIEARLRFALDAAQAAGALTLDHFRSRELAVDFKANGTPVTAADLAAERLLRERIADAYPGDGVIGEEEPDTRGSSGFTWILDPIDGTEAFRRGVPLFGTLVACEAEGEVIAGVIHCPAAGEVIAAGRGLGARWTLGSGAPRTARVRPTARLADALVTTTSLRACARAGLGDFYARLCDAAQNDRGWSDCYSYLLLATGRIDVAFDPVMAVWDNAPLLVVVEEAGGRFTDLGGERTIRGRGALATNGRLHEQVLAMIRDGGARGG